MDTITYLRQLRLGEYALFDFTLSVVGMAILAPFLSKTFRKFGYEVPKWNWVWLTLPISIVTHLMIGQQTGLVKNFFDPQGHLVEKIVVVACLIVGLRNIKKLPHQRSVGQRTST